MDGREKETHVSAVWARWAITGGISSNPRGGIVATLIRNLTSTVIVDGVPYPEAHTA